MQPIIVTTSFELLHVDFTGIEMTMELDQPPYCGEHIDLLWSLYETHHGLHDP